MQAHLGISPIAWWNDDLPQLSADVSIAECLHQARSAGYSGIETGQRFPKTQSMLQPILDENKIRVCGGWFSGTLLDTDIEQEKERIHEQMALFIALDAPCIVYGETASTIQNKQSVPLSKKRCLDDADMRTYGHKMTDFAAWCIDQGMPLSFHHHMGTVIETEQELDSLMNHSGEALPLLFDTGHMAFAGGDIVRVLSKHHKRITHVHTKDIRQNVIASLVRTQHSFLDAVIKGAFTVPGDGALDFATLALRLADYGYEGWFVVEAEQDPKINPPLRMAEIGYAELTKSLTQAGYTIT